jgi:transcriptional regulator NrdR family protein
MKHLVKRRGVEQKFDVKKVYASCYNACLNVPIGKQEAEKISEKVCKDVKVWIKEKKMISSDQIFKAIIRSMKKYDKEAAFMYETHRDIN